MPLLNALAKARLLISSNQYNAITTSSNAIADISVAVEVSVELEIRCDDSEGNGAVLVNACGRDLFPAINVQAFSVLSSDLLACAKLRRIWSSSMERSAHVRRNMLCVARVLGTDVNAGQLSCRLPGTQVLQLVVVLTQLEVP
ncbi:luc7-like protein 3 [Dorcoceras hygrometricum]|uniref:Luc7-like protein 3 n=1 Tax=Dorcoceras hygrometricum TaxID=472368 RepID=A0A2Z7DA82_9LAMI|nr:luc7-like protein 3 [Dorcoceras hygrometricum]